MVTSSPSFPRYIFILAGGPLVESTHGRAFTAPLVTITVVCVIASLALFHSAHRPFRRNGKSFKYRLDGPGAGRHGRRGAAALPGGVISHRQCPGRCGWAG